MNFLPDLKVICPVCKGSGLIGQMLALRYRGRSIADVLAMNICEAACSLRTCLDRRG